ncbi:MAG: family 43 glycosylhydrolase [Flavitalea sp.]
MRIRSLAISVFVLTLIYSCSNKTRSSAKPGETMMYKDSSKLNRPYAKDPSVVYFNGRYLMYYSVPPAKNTEGWGIAIAESTDLVNWKKTAEIAGTAAYEKKGLCAPGALVKDNQVHLFYQTYGNGPKDAICHAWSTDGINFTRNASNPVFSPGGAWNCGRAIDAEVIKFKDKYFLYYATRDPEFKIQMVGVASTTLDSDFGKSSWTHLSEDSAALKPVYAWEGECIEAPSVIERNGLLYMAYAGAYNNWPQQTGIATSTDGVHWTRMFTEPFLKNGEPGTWNSSESGHPDLFIDNNGKTVLFFQGNPDKGKTWLLSSRQVGWKKDRPVLY